MAINRLFTTLVFAYGIFVVMFAQTEKSLFVLAGDTTSSISLKDIRSIKYNGDKMIVSSLNGASDSWDISYVNRLSFGQTVVTSVTPLLPVKVEDDGLNIFITAYKGARLRVYDTNGLLLHSEKLTSTLAIINVAHWNKGLYIIDADSKIYKFFKE